MSCHDIGRGLNSVVRKTIKLMDQGEISKNAAKEIINTCIGTENKHFDLCGRLTNG